MISFKWKLKSSLVFFIQLKYGLKKTMKMLKRRKLWNKIYYSVYFGKLYLRVENANILQWI